MCFTLFVVTVIFYMWVFEVSVIGWWLLGLFIFRCYCETVCISCTSFPLPQLIFYTQYTTCIFFSIILSTFWNFFFLKKSCRYLYHFNQVAYIFFCRIKIKLLRFSALYSSNLKHFERNVGCNTSAHFLYWVKIYTEFIRIKLLISCS